MSSSPTAETCHQKNVLEWAIFGLSLAIIAGVIASLVHQALTVGDEPPRLVVSMGDPLAGNGQVRIPLSVTNEGDLSAIGVEVEVTGLLNGTEEKSTVNFDYIPHQAQRDGWVSFAGDVIPSGLSARVVGYADP